MLKVCIQVQNLVYDLVSSKPWQFTTFNVFLKNKIMVVQVALFFPFYNIYSWLRNKHRLLGSSSQLFVPFCGFYFLHLCLYNLSPFLAHCHTQQSFILPQSKSLSCKNSTNSGPSLSTVSAPADFSIYICQTHGWGFRGLTRFMPAISGHAWTCSEALQPRISLSAEFSVWGGPGTDPPWIPRDHCNFEFAKCYYEHEIEVFFAQSMHGIGGVLYNPHF